MNSQFLIISLYLIGIIPAFFLMKHNFKNAPFKTGTGKLIKILATFSGFFYFLARSIAWPFILIASILMTFYSLFSRDYHIPNHNTQQLYFVRNEFVYLFANGFSIVCLAYFINKSNFFLGSILTYLLIFGTSLYMLSLSINPEYGFIERVKNNPGNTYINAFFFILLLGIVVFFEVFLIEYYTLVTQDLSLEGIKEDFSDFFFRKKLRLFFYGETNSISLKDIALTTVASIYSLLFLALLSKIKKFKRTNENFTIIASGDIHTKNYSRSKLYLSKVDSDYRGKYFWRLKAILDVYDSNYSSAVEKMKHYIPLSVSKGRENTHASLAITLNYFGFTERQLISYLKYWQKNSKSPWLFSLTAIELCDQKIGLIEFILKSKSKYLEIARVFLVSRSHNKFISFIPFKVSTPFDKLAQSSIILDYHCFWIERKVIKKIKKIEKNDFKDKDYKAVADSLKNIAIVSETIKLFSGVFEVHTIESLNYSQRKLILLRLLRVNKKLPSLYEDLLNIASKSEFFQKTKAFKSSGITDIDVMKKNYLKSKRILTKLIQELNDADQSILIEIESTV